MTVELTSYIEVVGGRIAAQAFGAGPPCIVVVPGLLGHVDALWEDVAFARWARQLAHLGRVVIYDRLGTGASDPRPTEESRRRRIAELRAVIDDRQVAGGVVLLGWFDGAGVAAAASSHPSVVGLVLVGGFANPGPVEATLRRSAWGEGAVARVLAPEWAKVADGARIERATAAPSAGRMLLDAVGTGSVVAAAAVPTLVAHPTRSISGPGADVVAALARDVASEAPVRLVHLDTSDVVPWGGGGSDLLRAVEAGALPPRAPVPTPPTLVVVLVSDIVQSTARAALAGDREWRHLLETHDAVVAGRVTAHGGSVRHHTGDGVVATFPLATAALRAAWEVAAEARRVGLPVRVGLHAGEVAEVDGILSGLAVRTAAAVAGDAGPSDVVLSTTVRELASGVPLVVAPRGVLQVRGRDPLAIFALGEEPPPG